MFSADEDTGKLLHDSKAPADMEIVPDEDDVDGVSECEDLACLGAFLLPPTQEGSFLSIRAACSQGGSKKVFVYKLC